MVEETDDNTDVLIDSQSGETVSDNITKGLLSDGLNIKQNGLETSNVLGGLRLAYDISVHTYDEIGAIVYTNSDNEKFLNVLPYESTSVHRDENNLVDGMTAGFTMKVPSSFTSSNGNFTGRPTSAFHTHPGHPEANSYIGGPQPSDADLEVANNNYYINGRASGQFQLYRNLNYYILSRKTITRNGRTSNVSKYRALGGWQLLSKTADELLKE